LVHSTGIRGRRIYWRTTMELVEAKVSLESVTITLLMACGYKIIGGDKVSVNYL